jgi:hypothetical protein
VDVFISFPSGDYNYMGVLEKYKYAPNTHKHTSRLGKLGFSTLTRVPII